MRSCERRFCYEPVEYFLIFDKGKDVFCCAKHFKKMINDSRIKVLQKFKLIKYTTGGLTNGEEK